MIIAIFAATALQAQTENTSEKLIDQLKKGTVPGWQFARNIPTPAPVKATNTEQKESLVAQIRKGTAPGMKFMTATAATNRTGISPAAQQSAPLASELEMKKEPVSTITAPQIILNQEEAKKETPAVKQ
ncbi:MAG TPA: hypothetical protein VFT58_03945 [Nitrososphaera sp.]|nr:hypothetical protein [Nitrososphaera sp.]